MGRAGFYQGRDHPATGAADFADRALLRDATAPRGCPPMRLTAP